MLVSFSGSVQAGPVHLFRLFWSALSKLAWWSSLSGFYTPMPCFAGTGKTLVARALANECSRGTQRVAFFMRKGADCLSKWVGEAERQLRLLFDKVRCVASAFNLF